MKKNRAIWVALFVVAAAALLMFFVVLPQMRADKTGEELAKKAGDAAVQTEDAAGKAKDTAQALTDAAKTETLAKMARLKADTEAAAAELQGLFDAGLAPTAEQITAAKAKAIATLKQASTIKAPEGADAAMVGLIAKAQSGAEKALAAIEAMPTDADGARKAFDGMKSGLTSMFEGGEMAGKPDDAASAKLPAFDVLRVEPDGSTLIAGSAEPGARLAILDAGKVIASTEAGATGDFVAVLDNPLGAGDHQIVLEATSKDGKKLTSEEIATVSVPKDKGGELLAMVTKPGEASRILTTPKAKTESELAENVAKSLPAEPVTNNAGASAATPELPAASGDLANSAPIVKNGEAEQLESAAIARVDKGAPEVQVSAVEIEGDKIFVAGAAKPNASVRVYADDKLVSEVIADKNGRFVADNKLPLAVGNHTIRADVLAADGARVEFRASVPFFRPEGDQLAAVASDTTTPGSLEMQPLADGAYDKARLEADKAISLLKNLYADGKTPTVEELAAARSSTEIALKTLSQIKLADNAGELAKDIAAKTAAEADKALALLKSLPKDAGAVKTALDKIDDAVSSAIAPSMQTAAADQKKPAVAAPADAKQPDAATNVVASDKPATQQSSQSGQVAGSTQEAAGTTAVDTASQTAHAEVSAEGAGSPDQPKVIEQAPLKPSEASVIIRRGDTLWQISRRVYGKGVRYTTIYLANEKQITDPDRILPGQVFDVPDKPLVNAEELHRKRLGLE
ncbi:LysM peptidoglycan-binding domain-containing protein [Rhizobium sp. KVB221]|uniref:LysM peptidoglycan-binding domain-containing protein n=1 Tax=Rhizobium setariae TaxID=2801340 RepID=A0A936YN49_9HYPH|nr:LysM peptidoglycan-binding domain-containing protein [Rhizobium setariae]MBL0371194.1 LysM peptidoglycan-binding domain-containing protein [Rhizobium setariae]